MRRGLAISKELLSVPRPNPSSAGYTFWHPLRSLRCSWVWLCSKSLRLTGSESTAGPHSRRATVLCLQARKRPDYELSEWLPKAGRTMAEDEETHKRQRYESPHLGFPFALVLPRCRLCKFCGSLSMA